MISVASMPLRSPAWCARGRSRRWKWWTRYWRAWTGWGRRCAPSAPPPPTPRARTRAPARRVEAAIAAGRPVGPLAGVPVSIKDLILTRGVRTASGSAAYADFVPDEDDIVVERLKAADAVILGKTNVPEFGYSGV